MNLSPAGKRLIIAIPILLVVLYMGFLYWLYDNEESIVFLPSKDIAPMGNGVTCTSLVLLTNDGDRLSAWAIPDTVNARSRIWVLYLHGNTGNVSTRMAFYSKALEHGLNLFAPDYRGYGRSEGEPGETGFYLDATAAYEYLVRNLRIPEHHIVIFGQSLGGSVAINLATYEGAAGLIVEGTFTSLVDHEQEVYPIFPMGKIMRNRFDGLERITEVSMPKLFVHAIDDETIPIEHGRRLYASAPAPKRFLEVRGGHNAAYFADESEYFAGITKFISEVTSDSTAKRTVPEHVPQIPKNH